MGEFLSLVISIKENKDNFLILVEKMEPTIKKYVNLLYKDDK